MAGFHDTTSSSSFIVATINDFLHDSALQYMVLHGKSGSGKSLHLNEALVMLRMDEGEPTPTIVVWNQDEPPYSIVGHKHGILKFILVRRELDKVASAFIDEQQAVVLKL
jgi:hypothetical protein